MSSDDSFSVVTEKSWLSRVGGSFAGVGFGLLLFGASFVVLSWNEGRAVKRAKTLEFGQKAVVSVGADRVDPANEGKLVHVSAPATPRGEARDAVFAVAAPALALRRVVEMYQWTEEESSESKKKLGGGEETTTTYRYEKAWETEWIDSSRFQKAAEHPNPPRMPYAGQTFTPERVEVGAYQLPRDLLAELSGYQPLAYAKREPWPPAGLPATTQLAADGLYLGANPQEPAVGDVRVRFESIPPGPVTVLARQAGGSFAPFVVDDLGEISVLRMGTLSAKEVFAQEARSNTILTWVLRFVGFLMMVFGLALITAPLSVLASIVPFLGEIVGFGTGLLSLVVAAPLTLATIAVAWLAYRPVLAVLILLGGAACVVAGLKLRGKRAAATAQAQPA